MTEFRIPVLIMLVASLAPALGQADDEPFETVRAKTFAKEKFRFPADLGGDPVNVLFLAMSTTRESGEAQQQALLEWHAALEDAGAFSDRAVPYHFIVMESPPFFVKGMITGAMRDVYEGKVPLDRAAVFFVDDLGAFAASGNISLDDQPTLVLVSANGVPLRQFKGTVSESAVEAVVDAIDAAVAEMTAGT